MKGLIMIRMIFCLLLFINLNIFSQEQEFNDLLKKMNVQFHIPKNFIKVPLVEQRDAKYEIGFKHIKENIEVRINLYTEEPNTQNFEMILSMITYGKILNISQNENESPKMTSFKDEYVKNEYGADKGYTCAFKGNSTFSGKYKMVMMNVIYKKKVGAIFIYVLFDDQNILLNLSDISEAFYCVKYN
jgi:hypothetical protein